MLWVATVVVYSNIMKYTTKHKELLSFKYDNLGPCYHVSVSMLCGLIFSQMLRCVCAHTNHICKTAIIGYVALDEIQYTKYYDLVTARS